MMDTMETGSPRKYFTFPTSDNHGDRRPVLLVDQSLLEYQYSYEKKNSVNKAAFSYIILNEASFFTVGKIEK